LYELGSLVWLRLSLVSSPSSSVLQVQVQVQVQEQEQV